MSWFRCEADGHERRRVHMRSLGVALDRDTAIDDLRVWQDRVMAPGSRVKFPSSAELGERWGWSKSSAYRLMVDVPAWSDPSRTDEWMVIWNERGTKAERQRNERDTKHDDGKQPIDEERNEGGTKVERERNEGGHRRGVGSPSPPPSPSPEQQTSPSAPVVQYDEAPTVIDLHPKRGLDFAEVMRTWNAEIVPEARRRGGTASEHERLKPSAGMGVGVRQRLDQHGLDSCLAVLRWYATSGDSRAVFLREGGHELDTLMRPKNFETYLAKANAGGKNGHPQKPARKFDPPRPSPLDDDESAPPTPEQLAWLREQGLSVPEGM